MMLIKFINLKKVCHMLCIMNDVSKVLTDWRMFLLFNKFKRDMNSTTRDDDMTNITSREFMDDRYYSKNLCYS